MGMAVGLYTLILIIPNSVGCSGCIESTDMAMQMGHIHPTHYDVVDSNRGVVHRGYLDSLEVK